MRPVVGALRRPGRVETRVTLPGRSWAPTGGPPADGTALRLGSFLDGLDDTRARIGYVDLCWSADKSVSLAWAMAPTEAERNLIAQAHKDAVASALVYVESELGRARKGKAGRDGYDAGRIGWISFDHYASRPTVEVARTDPATGQPYTELVTLKVAGDPQLHTHVAVPNVVLTDDGRVGSLDLQRLSGRVHEFGALYQAYLASNLRRLGVEVALDKATGAARVTAVRSGYATPLASAPGTARTRPGRMPSEPGWIGMRWTTSARSGWPSRACRRPTAGQAGRSGRLGELAAAGGGAALDAS